MCLAQTLWMFGWPQTLCNFVWPKPVGVFVLAKPSVVFGCQKRGNHSLIQNNAARFCAAHSSFSASASAVGSGRSPCPGMSSMSVPARPCCPAAASSAQLGSRPRSPWLQPRALLPLSIMKGFYAETADHNQCLKAPAPHGNGRRPYVFLNPGGFGGLSPPWVR